MEQQRDMRIVAGSVIQVKGEVQNGWGGCLLIVDEVKSFGVQAYLRIPMKGDAFIRLEWKDIEYIGYAVYGSVNDEDEDKE